MKNIEETILWVVGKYLHAKDKLVYIIQTFSSYGSFILGVDNYIDNGRLYP